MTDLDRSPVMVTLRALLQASDRTGSRMASSTYVAQVADALLEQGVNFPDDTGRDVAPPSTAQPPPQHVPGAPSVHDLVIADLGCRTLPGEPVTDLLALLAERREFGLRKYGTHLQIPEPQRRPEMDLLEELGDALVYAFRARELGVPEAAQVYEQLAVIARHAAAAWYPASLEAR